MSSSADREMLPDHTRDALMIPSSSTQEHQDDPGYGSSVDYQTREYQAPPRLSLPGGSSLSLAKGGGSPTTPTARKRRQETRQLLYDLLPRSNEIDDIVSRARASYARFVQTSSPDAINSAIDDFTLAHNMTPDSDPAAWQRLHDLASALLMRYRHATSKLPHLEQTVALAKRAVNLSTTSRQRAESLSLLGWSLYHQFRRCAEYEDLEDAVQLLEEAWDLVKGSPAEALIVIRLGIVLTWRGRYNADVEDVERTISLLQHAGHAPHFEEHRLLFNDTVGAAMWIQSTLQPANDHPEADEALELAEQALAVTPKEHIHYMVFLYHYIWMLSYWRLNEEGQIHAVDLAQGLLERTPVGYPRRPLHAHATGEMLDYKCSMTGAEEDVQEALVCTQLALDLCENEVERPIFLISHAKYNIRRFELFGRSIDIDKGVELLRPMAEGSVAASPVQQQGCAALLCHALYSRFRWNGIREDVEASIRIGKIALSLGRNRKWVFALAGVCVATFSRYQLTNDEDDLDYAIENVMITLEDDDEPVAPATEWILLSDMYRTRFHKTGHLSDLEEATQHANKATTAEHVSLVDRTHAYAAVAACFVARYESFDTPEELETALLNIEEALRIAPAGHTGNARLEAQLGDIFALRYKEVQSAGDLGLALAAFRRGAHLSASPLRDRFKCAARWAELAHSHGSHALALDGYVMALELLPRLAWLAMHSEIALQDILGGSSSIACDAAACACTLGRYDFAVELLEQGRAVFWGIHLSLRIQNQELFEAAPALAQEFRDLSLTLDMGSSGGEAEKERQRSRRLVERWNELVQEIRQLPGFREFLQPQKFANLVQAAKDGAVAVLNISKYGCAGLLLRAKRAEYVPLPGVQHDSLKNLAFVLHKALSLKHDKAGAMYLDRVLRGIMDRLWTGIGEPMWHAIRATSTAAPGRPRVWWLPTGPLCHLPIHAACPDRPDTPGLPDLVVSSYTITLTALLNAQRKAANPPDQPTFLLVGQTSTPGQKPLSSVHVELVAFRQFVPASAVTELLDEHATVGRVQAALKGASWVHFACHGHQDQTDPLASCLRLHDGPLALSALVSARLRLARAEFAFLSACHTARGMHELPDEALHITAGLQLAGFRGVVATMWAIADAVAPRMVGAFYAYLASRPGGVDHLQAAQALGQAVRGMRRAGVPAIGWVPFVHVGV